MPQRTELSLCVGGGRRGRWHDTSMLACHCYSPMMTQKEEKRIPTHSRGTHTLFVSLQTCMPFPNICENMSYVFLLFATCFLHFWETIQKLGLTRLFVGGRAREKKLLSSRRRRRLQGQGQGGDNAHSNHARTPYYPLSSSSK